MTEAGPGRPPGSSSNQAPERAPTVSVSGLRKRFGTTVALDGVDAAFAPGVNGLLGPNGAGKTTMLRILATVLAADAGRVDVLGVDPGGATGRLSVRRRLGYLPQEPGFHRRFTAFELVDYIAILKEWADRRPRHDEVRRVLTLVGLEAVMHKRIGRLSGGMRRRVGIAQALLGSPDLLVLDEPTAGLDPEQRLRFRELLGTEAAGATVLLSTHQTDDVAALCQHVVVLLDGRIEFSGTPNDLAALARDRVWLAPERDPRAELAWVTGEGRVRHIGEPPAGAQLVEPTVEDGYLVLSGREARTDVDAGARAS
jgi:ABC-2 type transport system ATP-binding protein